MQPTLKTKSTDFLPQKPSMDGLNKPLPRDATEDNPTPIKEDSNNNKTAFEPPKQSTHIIDLKSSSASEDVNQNKATHVDMVAPNINSSSTKQLDDKVEDTATDVSQTTSSKHQDPHVSYSHVGSNKKKSNKVKWLLIVLAIVVLLIVAVVGGVYFANQNALSTTNSHNNVNI